MFLADKTEELIALRMSLDADKKNWSVYIISCNDGSLYTGISTDVQRRFEQHKNKKGAKYFYSRRPEKIVYIENNHNKSTAAQREYEIKALSRKSKQELIGLS